MSGFDEQPAGTVLFRFDDGSAIVKGDGTDAELEEMVIAFADTSTKTIPPEALETISSLRKNGLAIRFHTGDEDPRAFTEEQFHMVAETIRDLGRVDRDELGG
jgi:hypothetical protein